jgi:hypothetical protein
LLELPATALEEDDADGGDEGFGDNDRPEDSAGAHANGDRQEVGQGNFHQPEAEEIHDGGSDGITSAVKGLEHDHAVSVADIAVADDPQTGSGQRNDSGIAGEKADDRLGENDEKDADETEKDHVVEAGAPDGSLGALGLPGTQILAHEGGSGIAESPARQNNEDDNADSDGVAGERGGAEDADDANEADPTGMRDGKLQNAGEGDTQQTPENTEVETDLAAKDADALRAAEKAIELIENANAAACESGESSAGNAKLGKGAPAKDQARIEDKINDVGDPEEAHGDGCVAGAAEDGVVEEQQHDGAAATEGNAGVTGADGEDLPGRAHEAKQVRRVEKTRNANERGDCKTDGNGLNAGNGRAGRIFFADAACDHGGGREAEAEADGHDQAEERFREADGGNGIGAETADPENIHDGEKRLQHHLQDHGNGEKKNGAIEAAGGEVLVGAAKRFADGAPQGRHGSGESGLFLRHENLYILRRRFLKIRRAGAAEKMDRKKQRRMRSALAAD